MLTFPLGKVMPKMMSAREVLMDEMRENVSAVGVVSSLRDI